MNIPKVKDAKKYTGLYAVDFGDTSSVGFTAEEVAALLESEEFSDIKVYKIHMAYPDGKMELKGVPSETFQLEMGMFFYASDVDTASSDYERLLSLADDTLPPSRAKVQLAKIDDDNFTVAIFFPAEYNDEISAWLIDIDYNTKGAAAGGISQVQNYYDQNPEIIKSSQLHAQSAYKSKTGEELFKDARLAIQR